MASGAVSLEATNALMDLRKYDQQIREARDHYGTLQKPDFALDRKRSRAGRVDIGELKDVVLATATGVRPKEPMSSTTFSVEAREWDEHLFFWTLDLGDQRMIVKPVGSPSMGGSGYRCWLGVEQKFKIKYIAFPVLDPPESPSARDLVSGRQLSQRLASKRRAEELAEPSGPKSPKKPKTPLVISPTGRTKLQRRLRRVQTGSNSSEDSLSSDDEPLTNRRLPKNQARRGLQNDESTPANTITSPPAPLAATTGSRHTKSRSRKKAHVSDPEGLPDRPGTEVGRATAQTEREELSRREAEVSQELQVFINLKKELDAIRRRKEELAQYD